MIAAICINIVALAVIVAIAKALPRVVCGIIIVLWLIIFNVPFMEYSLCGYFYGLFDMPSLMLSLLSVAYIMREILIPLSAFLSTSAHPKAQKLAKRLESSTNLKLFPPAMCLVYALFGFVVYMGFFAPFFVNIYYLEFKMWVLILATLCLISYRYSAVCGALLVACMFAYSADVFGGRHIVSYVICPFLWLFSVCGAVIYGVKCLKNGVIKWKASGLKS